MTAGTSDRSTPGRSWLSTLLGTDPPRCRSVPGAGRRAVRPDRGHGAHGAVPHGRRAARSSTTATAGTRSPATWSPARPASDAASAADDSRVVGPLATGAWSRPAPGAATGTGRAAAPRWSQLRFAEQREGVWLRPDNLRPRRPELEAAVDELGRCTWFVADPDLPLDRDDADARRVAVGPRRVGRRCRPSCVGRWRRSPRRLEDGDADALAPGLRACRPRCSATSRPTRCSPTSSPARLARCRRCAASTTATTRVPSTPARELVG